FAASYRCAYMVAVLAWNHALGGVETPRIASPITRVERTRDSRISARFLRSYRQLTLRPARLMTASAPLSSCVQSPNVWASHCTTRHGARRGFRLRTITSWASACRARARTLPTWPEPPGITIFILSFPASETYIGQKSHRLLGCLDLFLVVPSCILDCLLDIFALLVGS